MPRICAIHLPQVLSRPGNSLGPMKTSATMAMTSSSGLSMPNMETRYDWNARRSDLGGGVLVDLARRRGRGLGRDRLGRVARLSGSGRGLVRSAADALLEGREALAEV